MLFEQRLSIAAPAEDVWSLMSDVPRMSAFLPGLEGVREEAPDTFTGALRVTVGPVTVRLEGRLHLAERDRERLTTRLDVEAVDRRIRSSVRSSTTMRALPNGGDTDLHVRTDAAVLGKLGQLGQAVLRKKTDQMLAQFAANMAAELARDHEGGAG
jgi:carbon monoxide dehydrogenase subunit G